MSRSRFRGIHAALVFLGFTLCLAVPAFAASEEGGSSSEMIWQAVNLLILVAVIVFAARKPATAFFASRREQIKGEIDDASTVLSQAEARFAEWQRKLVELDQEVEEIRNTARTRAEQERQHILAEAEEAAERIQRDASAAIAQELRRAQGDLRQEAATLASEMAERILTEQIGESDRDRLLDEFISGVEQPQAGS